TASRHPGGSPMSATNDVSRLGAALPFWLSLVMIPLALAGASLGGWAVFLLPVYGWIVTSILDAIAGLDRSNPDTDTPEESLFWFPVQAGTLYGLIWYVTHTDHLGAWEKVVLFFGVGVITGSVGITYAHELMHQKNRLERWLGDLLLATVLYSHFRTEHLLVH